VSLPARESPEEEAVVDRIREMLDRIGELSDQELNELKDLIVTEFGALEDQELSDAVAETMEKLADNLDVVQGALSDRATRAAELAQRANAAKSRVRGEGEGDSAEQVTDAPEGGEAAAGDGAGDKPHAFVDADGDGNCDVCGKSADDPVHTVVAASAAAPVAEAPPAEVTPAAIEPPVSAQATPPVATQPSAADSSTSPPVAQEQAAQPPAQTTETTPAAQPQAPTAPPAESAAEQTAGTAAPAEEQPAADKAAPTSEAPASDANAAGGEAAEPAAQTGEDTTEKPVTASATPEASEPVVTAPADRQPIARPQALVAITAGADIPGVVAGSDITDMDRVAEIMTAKIHQLGRGAGSVNDGQVTVATLTASFPEDRVLLAKDPEGNTRKIESVVSPQAITAAGGLCAPVDVRYDLFGLGEVDTRPVRDALAGFNAARGGVRYMTSPTIADLDGASSLWTLQDDIDAATDGAPDPVKPCLRVACGDEVTVYTDAIPMCLTFGNLNARAYPEMVRRHNELALVQHARFAETRLLTRIGALSTAVTTTRKIGATADLLASVDRALAAYRSRHRLPATTRLRMMAPEWLRALLRADMAYRMPGDGLAESFGIADAMIEGFFTSRNVNITWFIDGETGQVFSAQAAGSLQDFPDSVIWYLFAEGTFLFLDGGTLDLGLIRDSTLIGTNDYKTFVESFEGVAKIGIESLRVTSRLEPTGMAGGTVDLTAGVAA
jgi:hypothetical protein